MSHRMTFVVGLGVGYVLGARAGRERYEAIVRTAQKIKDHPTVQSSAGVLQAQAGQAMHSVRDRLGGTPSRTEDDVTWTSYDERATAGRPG